MNILVLCTGNSARSQMAEGWFHHLAAQLNVQSAGFKPKGLHPLAVIAMQQVDVDITAQTSKAMADLPTLHNFDYVITVCSQAEAACPVFPGKTTRLFWPFSDPAAFEGAEAERLAQFCLVRDQIGKRIREFLLEKQL
jgi:arsenate reductase (thioredoxin)